jgi:Gas vesicle synthesis protein GvpL/GvpF
MSAAEPTVVHAYGVVDAATGAEVVMPAGGLGGAEVQVVRCGVLGVLASRVSAESYGEQAWARNGQDARWIGEVARAHHDVLQQVATTVDVVPMRLPGIYADETALRHVVGSAERVLLEALAEVRGHVEWGAKVFDLGVADGGEEDEAPATGADYLRMRSQQASRRQQAVDRRSRAVLDLHERLAHAATHAVLNAPQDPALSGRREPMLLNAAYLVGRAEQETFVAAAQQLSDRVRDEGLLVELTGPWPPYNFGVRPTQERSA